MNQKKRRYFFHVGFKGIQYRGWQRQKGVVTVQSVLEDSFEKVFKTHLSCIGCGRTDAKVHAIQYFFHADIKNEREDDLLFVLNKVLPDDIAVFDIIPMEGFPHAQLDAIERTYDYFIHIKKDPFLSDTSALYLNYELDIEKMSKAVSLLTKYNDYKSFCKTPLQHANTLSNITSAKLFVNSESNRIRLQLTSDKFIKAMVRVIVGKLIDIGTGALSVEQFEQDLINKEVPTYILPAYPQGLYLSKVNYPFLNIPARTEWLDGLHSDEDNYWKLV
jgi:tRNA pseudouridine38-40 synthase